MCKYFDDFSNKKCTHEVLPGKEYCIFHLKDDEKDIDEFNVGIKQILEINDGDIINFNGFYFPPGTINFYNKTFNKKIDFKNVIFLGNADFRSTNFLDEVDFRYAKFFGNVDFTGAEISGESDFKWVNFSKNANFYETKFLKKSSFSRAKFLEYTNFNGTEFLDVDFICTKFLGDTYFNNSIFSHVMFSFADFTRKLYFIPKKSGVINFLYTFFSEDVKIKADLSQSFFLGSNIERVDLTNSTFGNGINEKKYIIFEESHEAYSNNWKKVEGIYRRLKESYQRHGDYSLAGEFYYREMECRREQVKGYQRFIWEMLFKRLLGYGEKPFNVIYASFFIIILFALFYFYSGIVYIENNHEIIINHTPSLKLLINFIEKLDLITIHSVIKDFLWCVYTSIITFTTLGYGDVHPTGFWSRLFASIESLIGIILTALFIFTFTRKMLR